MVNNLYQWIFCIFHPILFTEIPGLSFCQGHDALFRWRGIVYKIDRCHTGHFEAIEKETGKRGSFLCAVKDEEIKWTNLTNFFPICLNRISFDQFPRSCRQCQTLHASGPKFNRRNLVFAFKVLPALYNTRYFCNGIHNGVVKFRFTKVFRIATNIYEKYIHDTHPKPSHHWILRKKNTIVFNYD